MVPFHQTSLESLMDLRPARTNEEQDAASHSTIHAIYLTNTGISMWCGHPAALLTASSTGQREEISSILGKTSTLVLVHQIWQMQHTRQQKPAHQDLQWEISPGPLNYSAILAWVGEPVRAMDRFRRAGWARDCCLSDVEKSKSESGQNALSKCWLKTVRHGCENSSFRC